MASDFDIVFRKRIYDILTRLQSMCSFILYAQMPAQAARSLFTMAITQNQSSDVLQVNICYNILPGQHSNSLVAHSTAGIVTTKTGHGANRHRIKSLIYISKWVIRYCTFKIPQWHQCSCFYLSGQYLYHSEVRCPLGDQYGMEYNPQ